MENLNRKVPWLVGGLALFGGLAISDCEDRLVSERETVLAESELENCLYARLIYHFRIKESGCGAEYTDHSHRLEVYDCRGEKTKAELGPFLREENIIVAKDGKRFMVKKGNCGYEISATAKNNSPFLDSCSRLKFVF